MRIESIIAVAIALLPWWFENPAAADMQAASSRVVLKGQSSGGTMTLMKIPSHEYPHVVVTNYTGDSASTVLERFQQALADCPPCQKYYGQAVVERSSDSLVLLGGDGWFVEGKWLEAPRWILGGSDRGFDVPPCPMSLSVSYQTTNVVLSWVNVKSCDYVWIFLCTPTPKVVGVVPGTATRFVYEGQWRPPGFLASSQSMALRFAAVAVRNGTPSNAAVIGLDSHSKQEVVLNVPFTDNVAPGFERWTHNTPADGILCNQANLSGVKPGADVQHLKGKGFYQIVTARGPGRGGVQRRFIGLNSGHTYRVTAQLSILEATNGQWAFSFHAAANPPGQTRLNQAQLAGLAELSPGLAEPTAGQIARYDSSAFRKGQWETKSSAASTADNLAGDITIPSGSDSLTVWFRLECKAATETGTTVGIKSVAIEDLGTKLN